MASEVTEQRAAKLLFLFGHDSDGNERVEPKDETIEEDAIAAVMYEHPFNDALVASRLRDVPVVSKWVT